MGWLVPLLGLPPVARLPLPSRSSRRTWLPTTTLSRAPGARAARMALASMPARGSGRAPPWLTTTA
eukprot:15466404-Alexandrium_andersonii.AAC.1